MSLSWGSQGSEAQRSVDHQHAAEVTRVCPGHDALGIYLLCGGDPEVLRDSWGRSP